MIFKNPLGISNLFWTPETYQELEDRCCSYSGAERAIALTTMAYTMNMCAKAVDDAIAEQEADAYIDDYEAMQEDIATNG